MLWFNRNNSSHIKLLGKKISPRKRKKITSKLKIMEIGEELFKFKLATPNHLSK